MTSAIDVEVGYYALVYLTVSGRIVDEIPLQAMPQWNQTIDADGTWSITTQIGPDDGSSGKTKTELHAVTDKWRHSVAICWGDGSGTDYVCQAGPLTACQLVSEQPPILKIGGTGFWPLLRKLAQIASTWPGVSLAQAGGADTTYTSSLQGIAVAILTNALARQPYPLDLPGPIGGTATQTYFGYELISAGQRLQELTQGEGGPDILLKPYLTGDGHVRHQALIGNPTLATSGRPLVFDYPGNAVSILPTDDGSNLSTTTYEKGGGIEYATLWARSSDPSLTDDGWPLLENVDTSHSGETVQATLQSWSDGTQALTGRPIATWAVAVAQDDADYPFGSYDAGATGIYNVQEHCWLLDGLYTQRILGLQNGSEQGQVVHLLQTMED
ncbi:MAG TPA: hypothetical protein VHX38_02660 [Pseudonocardiaceae bacterium]|nr:hypothetical protein [Pseudonocardiaceae bacterium]